MAGIVIKHLNTNNNNNIITNHRLVMRHQLFHNNPHQ